ncbi:MAG: type I-E CRISPR-associated protein Cas7/Cse4/CasC, partial [Chloroflexota bacterium]
AASRESKKAGKEGVPAEIRSALDVVLDGGRAVDLALFGRMLADRPEKNVDAACQVAHAISTHRASMEFDYFTAVDDLKGVESAGAGMVGTVEFNSACFYRYANVDLAQLSANLKDDELAAKAALAFVRASVSAVPGGKQHSMAAQNPPSFVLAVLRRQGLWSLANSFLKPVRAEGEGDLVERSVAALDSYWGKLSAMYGDDGIAGVWCASIDDGGLDKLKPARLGDFPALVRRLDDTLSSAVSAGGRA